MIDDPSVFKLPDLNYTPLQTSFLEEKPKRKFPMKLVLLPLLFIAALPLVFFAYQNSRASEADTEADALLTDIQITRRPSPRITKKPVATGEAVVMPKEESESASPDGNMKDATDEGYLSTLSYYGIDSPDDKSTTVLPGKKQQIETILEYLKLKSSLLENFVIVMASTTAFTDGKPASVTHEGKPIEIKPLVQNEKGFALVENKLIVLDSSLAGDELDAVLTHQIGHIVSQILTADEFKAYMKARDITNIIIDPWYEYWNKKRAGLPPNTEWKKSPAEDFAEVFKLTYGNRKPTANWKINTLYGEVTASQKIWLMNNITPKIR